MPRPGAVKETDMSETQKQILNLEILICSRYPLIYVVSPEENRVVEALNWIARRLNKKTFYWSCISGLQAHDPAEPENQSGICQPDDPATRDPAAALSEVLASQETGLFVFKDFHIFMDKSHPGILRSLREAAHKFPAQSKTIVLISPVLNLPLELEKDVTALDFPMPGPEELGAALDNTARGVASNPNYSVDLSGDAREELIKAAHGLTLIEAENVFTKSLVVSGRLGNGQIAQIIAEKRQIIRKSGLLDFYDPEVGMDGVGGLENLKRWLTKRKLAFSDRARSFGLPSPRGVLMLGVQGCGKSMCAKAVSALWNLPLLRLDFGRVFQALTGGSEESIRRALLIAEGVAPCVLWVDEIDKAFGGGDGRGGDSGASRRVLGAFLTWLGDKKSPVFVAATANNVSAMPPELLRKGRFDEIFFIDLPNERERRNILAIHLKNRGRNPSAFDLESLSQAMEGFSGAEIEQTVVSALFDAFYDQGRDLAAWDIMMAASETVPLSKTMREEIDALRQWCAPRAREASEGLRALTNRRNPMTTAAG